MKRLSASLSEPAVRRVVVSSLTLSGAVGVFALSFGVASVSAGASVMQTCALSLFVFTGASQFSAMSVVGAGGSMAAAFGGAALLAARNFVYGLALSSSAKSMANSLPRRLFASHFVIDETTALALAQESPRLRKIAFWTTGIGLFSFWNLGTHREYASNDGSLAKRRDQRLRNELRTIIERHLEHRAREICTGDRWEVIQNEMLSRSRDPWSAADEMLQGIN